MPDATPETPAPVVPPKPAPSPAAVSDDDHRERMIPRARFDEVNARKAEAEAAARVATEARTTAEAAARAAAAELAAARTRAALERELLTMGVPAADLDETADEFADRYSRHAPGEDGKKPSVKDWIEANKGKKWASAYLPKPATDADPADVTPPPKEAAPVRKPANSPAPSANPNAGTRAAVTPATGARWSPERVHAASPNDIRANLPAILAEMQQAGEITIAPSGRGADIMARLGIGK